MIPLGAASLIETACLLLAALVVAPGFIDRVVSTVTGTQVNGEAVLDWLFYSVITTVLLFLSPPLVEVSRATRWVLRLFEVPEHDPI